ncbi:MAG: type II toxin-antitoxin system VapC family toxin [Moorellales bacterium]
MNLIDSCGWLEFLADGPLADKYAPYFETPQEVITPAIVVYEVAKKVWRERGREAALAVAAQMQQTRIVPLDFRLSLAATEAAIRWKLPLADAVVYATAQANHSRVITSDAHFEGLPGVVFVPREAK